MSVEGRLIKTNKNIKDMRKELLMWAYGLKKPEPDASWWSRNYLNILFYTLFGTLLITCYILGWTRPYRILGVLLILKLARYAWKLIKKAWVFLKLYIQARRLLKQVSGLKKE